jgi:hypothetical protein
MSELFYNAKNLIVSNGFLRNPNRYYLEEFFNKKPGLVTDLTPSSADDSNDGATGSEIAIMISANKNFMVSGTNATSSSTSFSSTKAGINLTTGTLVNDQVLISPQTTLNFSAWNNIRFGTENEVEWECAVSFDNLIEVCYWAGLNSSNTSVIVTNSDKAFFFFDSGTIAGSGTSMSTSASLHFCYSINGTHYVTDLGITVESDIIYRLRISIDINRKVSVFVNETQYGLTTSASSTGVTVSNERQKSNQLTNDIDLKSYVGAQTTNTTAKVLTLCYEKISRLLFE